MATATEPAMMETVTPVQLTVNTASSSSSLHATAEPVLETLEPVLETLEPVLDPRPIRSVHQDLKYKYNIVLNINPSVRVLYVAIITIICISQHNISFKLCPIYFLSFHPLCITLLDYFMDCINFLLFIHHAY